VEKAAWRLEARMTVIRPAGITASSFPFFSASWLERWQPTTVWKWGEGDAQLTIRPHAAPNLLDRAEELIMKRRIR
jgi:hypothetical protein